MAGRTREKPPEDEVVTPEELAAELKISRATIYSWRSRRQGPEGFVAGGSLRFRRSAITRWLAACGDSTMNGTR